MPASNLPEYRHMRSGSLNIPPQATTTHKGTMNPAPASQRFEGPRSPPNTSHVPCKFFRQGACQAGSACPFSHDIGVATETVCKYFAKGNCKFGPRCANIHVLPDGRRINYHKNGVTIGNASINLGSRVNPPTFPQSSSSALTNSFMRADGVPPYTAANPYGDERFDHQLDRQPSMENGLPTIDTTYSADPTSNYGSPREDDPGRLGLGLSPMNTKVLSVMDAPLPASFDSNGISHAARYGPWPASVPSQFGLESPSPSLHNARDDRTSETLKNLRSSAFGGDQFSTFASAHDSSAIGSSPPANWGVEEHFGKRAMHSSSFRYAKPKLMSSSAPKVDRDWDQEFMFLEEDYVPGSLANEVLTPQEKARRGSIRLTEEEKARDIPTGSSLTKFGSPMNSGSPSRWGPLFQRQREEEMESGSMGRSMKHAAASAFGHVGSPLRNSSLATDGELNSMRLNGRSRSGGEPTSALTQQLQRTRLSDDGSGAAGASSSPHLHPNAAAAKAGIVGIIGKERERERGLERHVSSGSIGSSVTGRFTTPIDEEDPSFVFSMEEEDEAQLRARKRASGGGVGGGGWSYAGIAAGKHSSANGGGSGANKSRPAPAQ
ncbi:uncharacterized protein E0L32_000733 [Thyridium curvatum]|uniref:C3H1-type domain-containing protein n=1 Tax=Thyridium curvatum TaxID=1093900 RepID=A0A507B0F4_9PEZI|nr:uncharacterized protein E0L32_000733 [Thyridium curvatum]TPX12556.1 hypothetical protein E0L32_000733 [Thyridium curvatum]